MRRRQRKGRAAARGESGDLVSEAFRRRQGVTEKLQAPRSEPQRSSKLQNTAGRVLDLGVCCFSGAWMLVLGGFSKCLELLASLLPARTQPFKFLATCRDLQPMSFDRKTETMADFIL